MIDKYIIELLKTHTRVIIPDFGAFIVKITEAIDGGEAKRTISFNDFLKFNDGVLTNYIIKTENISKTEAVKKIKEYIKSIEQELKKSNTYKIEGLGDLSKDSHGGIIFTTSGEKIEKTEAEKVEKKVEAKQPEKKQPETVKKDEIKKVEQKKEEPKKEPVLKKETITKTTTKIEKKPVVAQKKQVPKSSKKINVLVPVIIIVVLVAAIIWSLFYFDVIENINKKYFAKTEKEIVKVEKQKPQKTIKNIIDTKKTKDTTKSSKEVKEAETKIVKTKAEPSKKIKHVAKKQTKKVQKTNVRKYYVVAGSFRIETNAKNFINELTSKGFTPEYIGERNGFFTVCYSSFDSEREAYNELERMKNQQIQCWVLHY